MKTSEMLDRAADLIEERGWTHGRGWPETADDDQSPLCLEGGIFAAVGAGYRDRGFSKYKCPAYRAVVAYLNDNPEANPRRLVPFLWNDSLIYKPGFTGYVGGSLEAAEERGRQRVIEVLRACAVIEAAREREADAQRMPEAMVEGVLHP